MQRKGTFLPFTKYHRYAHLTQKAIYVLGCVLVRLLLCMKLTSLDHWVGNRPLLKSCAIKNKDLTGSLILKLSYLCRDAVICLGTMMIGQLGEKRIDTRQILRFIEPIIEYEFQLLAVTRWCID